MLLNIGILGSGNLGAELARKLSAAGYKVKLATSRGTESLKDIVRGTTISVVAKEDVAKDADAVILSIPFARNPEVASLVADASAGAIFMDTSNDYPARDGHIAEVEHGMGHRTGRPTLGKGLERHPGAYSGRVGAAAGTADWIAIPIAGDDVAAKRVVADPVSATGFDTVEAGNLVESWRFQPAAPAYCTELTIEDLEVPRKMPAKNACLPIATPSCKHCWTEVRAAIGIAKRKSRTEKPRFCFRLARKAGTSP